jgi:L-lactate dehydrogenase (cytochrome)
MRVREFATLLRPLAAGEGSDGRLARCHNIEDLRAEARRFLPRAVFDFVDGGAEDEVTLRRNRAAFGEIDLVPRVLRDVGEIDLKTEILGCRSSLPLALAPTGGTGLVRSGGEADLAAAAGVLGIPCTVSTMASRSLEEVAATSTGPLWFQLYLVRDRGRCRDLIDRAKAAGYRALMLTVDTPLTGGRERDLRNDFTLPPSIGPGALVDGLRRPRWAAQFLRARMPTLGNFDDGHLGFRDRGVRASAELDPSLSWNDLAWIREAWGAPIVLKGVLSAADATEAVAGGASGIVVSNHGGRQLDGAPATMDVLAEIVDAVGDRAEVLLDSGVRRGADVARALALGARACLTGRAHLYGYAAGGGAGVERAVRLLEVELRRAMTLLGAPELKDLDRSFVRSRSAPPGAR